MTKVKGKAVDDSGQYDLDNQPETDEDEYIDRPPLSHMTKEERDKYIYDLWRKCIRKSMGAAMILDQFTNLNTKIAVFGRAHFKEKIKENLIKTTSIPSPIIIMPQSKFKLGWNIVIILLLLYTSTVVPYRVAFIDESSTAFKIFEYGIDGLFMLDIIVNFLSAIEIDDMIIETRPKKIAIAYIRFWFLFDLLATFPTQVFET